MIGLQLVMFLSRVVQYIAMFAIGLVGLLIMLIVLVCMGGMNLDELHPQDDE